MMTGYHLNQLYGAMISPSARVDIPEAWLPAVHEAMQALCDLPSEVRAFIIVLAIDRDFDGDLTFHIAGAVQFVNTAGMQMVRDVIERAQVSVPPAELH